MTSIHGREDLRCQIGDRKRHAKSVKPSSRKIISAPISAISAVIPFSATSSDFSLTSRSNRIIFHLIPTQLEGALMRRHVGGAGKAAPAPVLRKHGPGRRRVTVRPHYGGPPTL